MQMEPTDAATPSSAQVARKTRSGVVWTVGTGLVTRGIGLFTTLLLTRYMSPDEAGAVNVALTLYRNGSWPGTAAGALQAGPAFYPAVTSQSPRR